MFSIKLEIKQLKIQLTKESEEIEGHLSDLDENALKKKSESLNTIREGLKGLGAQDDPAEKMIHQVEDQIEFIEEVKGAHGKEFIKLKDPQEDIQKLRHDKELMTLYQEVQNYRREKENKVSLEQDPQHRLKRSVAKAKFAYRLGVEPKYPSTGVHATFFMRSTTGKTLGVFKKADLRVGELRRIFRTVGDLFGIGQERILNKGKYAQIAGEKAAYIIKQKMEKAAGAPFTFGSRAG